MAPTETLCSPMDGAASEANWQDTSRNTIQVELAFRPLAMSVSQSVHTDPLSSIRQYREFIYGAISRGTFEERFWSLFMTSEGGSRSFGASAALERRV
jgi:hypothetical protein